jgi:hypothetical protein
MTRCTLALALLLSLAPALPAAQLPTPALTADKGTFLGILFKALPDARTADARAVSHPRGVIVTHVLPDSPAAAAELQRDDIVLQYNGEKIRDPEQLARLIRADRPGRKVSLTFLRGGRELTATATLERGPVLQLAPAAAAVKEADVPRGLAKQSGPPAVSVSAAPLDDGGVKLTIEYYQETTGRYEKVTCSGTPTEIDRELQRLPSRVQELTRVALKRFGTLELNRARPLRSSSPSKGR